jgi:ribonucleoside-triphosphate reductase
MDKREEIENRIQDLKTELETVEGSPTEIYTRIVGYYRSLKNWNRGKREEYDHRVTFGSDSPARENGTAEAFAEAAIEAASAPAPEVSRTNGIHSYAYYFRESCPNCPPVRSFVETLELNGKMVDVDTGEGMAEAIQHQILSTPTVLLKDGNGDTVAQAASVSQLRNILESAS